MQTQQQQKCTQTLAQTFSIRLGEIETLCGTIAKGNQARADNVAKAQIAQAAKQWRGQLKHEHINSSWSMVFPDRSAMNPTLNQLKILRKVLPH